MKNSFTKSLTFVGADGSLGYEYGKMYVLQINFNEDGTLNIRDMKKIGEYCPYSSFTSFLMNWGI